MRINSFICIGLLSLFLYSTTASAFSEFVKACQQGERGKVETLLKQEQKKLSDEDKSEGLKAAVEKGQIQVVDILLDTSLQLYSPSAINQLKLISLAMNKGYENIVLALTEYLSQPAD